MRITPIVLSLLLLAAAAAAADSLGALEARIRRLTLAAAERPADELVRDPQLAEIARAHSRAMHDEQRLAHELHGAGPDERLALRHRRLFGLIAENVAMQKGWPEHADPAGLLVDGWMNSPGHRRNILAPYRSFEVGCDGDTALIYCTQLFVRAAARLADPVDYRQPAGTNLVLHLAGVAHGAARVSLGPAAEPGASSGTPWRQNTATLALPGRPGLYRLRLWQAEADDPERFRLIPGPYVCVVLPDSPSDRLPEACPGAG